MPTTLTSSLTPEELVHRVTEAIDAFAHDVFDGTMRPDEDLIPVLLGCRDNMQIVAFPLPSLNYPAQKAVVQKLTIPRLLIDNQCAGCGLAAGAWTAEHTPQSGAFNKGTGQASPPRRREVVAGLAQWNDGTIRSGAAEVTRRPGAAPRLGQFTFATSFLDRERPTNFGAPIAEALSFVRDNPGATGDDYLRMKASFADAGRNDPCPCGSGRKYKACCLN